MCRCLVEDHGVDVNQRTLTGDPALAISAAYGTPAITRYLLGRGADPTLAGALCPPLHAATTNGWYPLSRTQLQFQPPTLSLLMTTDVHTLPYVFIDIYSPSSDICDLDGGTKKQ